MKIMKVDFINQIQKMTEEKINIISNNNKFNELKQK